MISSFRVQASPSLNNESQRPSSSPPPSPKANPKQTGKHSRSRGGCTRCRGRRQKCDEEKPMCSRCKADGAPKCSYTLNLQWGGRKFQSYAQNADIKKYETEPGTFVYVTRAKEKRSKAPSSPSVMESSPTLDDRLSRSLSPLDCSTPAEQLLLHHFANEASRMTSCHPHIQSDFNSILLPMALSYPPLLSALLALSLIHRTSLFPLSSSFPSPHQSLSLPNTIINLKTLSITKLRSALLSSSSSSPHQQEQHADAVLATALTLCMCEIHSGGDVPHSWRLHLEGASAILSQSSLSLRPPDPNSTSGLLKRWYDSVEALAAITSKGLRAGQLPPSSHSLSSSDTDMGGVEGEGAGPEEVFLDDYYGFCTDLIPAFKEIGAAAWERRCLSTSSSILSPSDLDLEAGNLEQNIIAMLARDANSPPNFYPGVREKLDPDVIAEFYACNEAYQHTALLYIYRRVCQLPSTSLLVQACVKSILSCVSKIRPRSGLSPYIVLVPPLFAAGREASGDEREIVRGMMREVVEVMRLRNVRRCWEILEEGWEKEGGVELPDGEECDFIPY